MQARPWLRLPREMEEPCSLEGHWCPLAFPPAQRDKDPRVGISCRSCIFAWEVVMILYS